MKLKLLSFWSLTLKMLHNASKAVAVGSDQHPFPLFDLRNNLFVPEGQCSGDGVLQTLTAGELVLSQVGIAAVLQKKFLQSVHRTHINNTAFVSRRCHLADGLVEVMVLIHGWRRSVKGASPDLDLGFSVFSCSLRLIQPGQAAVVALIEAPGPVDRQPHLVDAVQDEPQSADGPLQDGGVANIKLIAGVWCGAETGDKKKVGKYMLDKDNIQTRPNCVLQSIQ